MIWKDSDMWSNGRRGLFNANTGLETRNSRSGLNFVSQGLVPSFENVTITFDGL